MNNQYNIILQQVLDQLRNLKVRNNQLEELVRSLETDVETHKRDNTKLSDDKQVLQSEKERFEVETEDLSARMAVSYAKTQLLTNLNYTLQSYKPVQCKTRLVHLYFDNLTVELQNCSVLNPFSPLINRCYCLRPVSMNKH